MASRHENPLSHLFTLQHVLHLNYFKWLGLLINFSTSTMPGSWVTPPPRTVVMDMESGRPRPGDRLFSIAED